jgi:hypothetical protein
MTDPTAAAQPVAAGPLLIDLLRTFNPLELELLGEIGRNNRDAAREHDETMHLAEFCNVLAITADTLLAQHPLALNARDLADLDMLGDTPAAEQQ